ncbi:hypothetical protein BpHYR1_024860 [Brachionus plicatilis]|uniref:Uncharacterized protein n=1 Tax=Brachionus plicatilis TaxID=10195 RepID=A0A3M7RD71_BRAPC|nr:hypothetical protein BpHYR1_024860 [Brachionus plicatilis]
MLVRRIAWLGSCLHDTVRISRSHCRLAEYDGSFSFSSFSFELMTSVQSNFLIQYRNEQIAFVDTNKEKKNLERTLGSFLGRLDSLCCSLYIDIGESNKVTTMSHLYSYFSLTEINMI